ncbi:hypothetical protein AKJ16_DCAP17755 [Drosera capensis]
MELFVDETEVQTRNHSLFLYCPVQAGWASSVRTYFVLKATYSNVKCADSHFYYCCVFSPLLLFSNDRISDHGELINSSSIVVVSDHVGPYCIFVEKDEFKVQDVAHL